MPLNIEKNGELNEQYIQALLLAKVVERTLKQRAGLSLSSKPSITTRPIVEFLQRMRTSGLGKFDVATYIAAVNFYKNDSDMKKNYALGALVIYIGEDYIVNLFKKMGYPEIEQDAYDELEDACGTLCNIIAGKFKAGLMQLGYVDLAMSHFSCFRNEVLNGIDYDYKETEKFEISFEVDGEKRLVAELTLGQVPEADL